MCVKGPYAHNKLNEGDNAIIEIVAACREGVGPDFVMMVDVCYCWSNAKEALRVIRQLEPFDLFFLETPLQLDDLDGYAFLHDHAGIPIAAGELQNTRFEFLDLMDRGKVDVAQPDVGRVGGLTEARRVCELAEKRGRLRLIASRLATQLDVLELQSKIQSQVALPVHRIFAGPAFGIGAAARVGTR